MSEYTRHLRDVIFHVQNAQRSVESAQAKAPESDKSAIARFYRGLTGGRRWAVLAARRAERRGGVR